MRASRSLMAAAGVVLLAATASGCSSFPEGDPSPSTVRVYLDGDFDQTWQLAECTTPNEASLAVTGSNTFGQRLVIEIADGAGDVTVFDDISTISLTGSVEEYEVNDDGVFTAKGDYTSGEVEGEIELVGVCSGAASS